MSIASGPFFAAKAGPPRSYRTELDYQLAENRRNVQRQAHKERFLSRHPDGYNRILGGKLGFQSGVSSRMRLNPYWTPTPIAGIGFQFGSSGGRHGRTHFPKTMAHFGSRLRK